MTINRNKVRKFFRVWHKRLGLVIGIQLLFWTLGGVYFAWFHIDNVHGDYERKTVTENPITSLEGMQPPDAFLKKTKLKKISDFRIGRFQERIVVRLYQGIDNVEMYDALSGQLLSPITIDQARQSARNDFALEAKIVSVREILEKKGEYKGPVPAYRIDFDNSKATHLYVHRGSGKVTARRNSVWRGFDFLWMLHILDFNERDDMNNWILKILSILGVITILSGYILWISNRRRRPAK